MLTQRLGELREAAIVEQDADGAYALTTQGRALGEQLVTLDAWARRWRR